MYSVLSTRELSKEVFQGHSSKKPLIPFHRMVEGMAKNFGHYVSMQSDSILLRSQIDLSLGASFSEIVLSQGRARELINHWSRILLPAVLAIFTRVKSFCILYGSLDEKLITELMQNVSLDKGKEAFTELMSMFQDETILHSTYLSELMIDLKNFMYRITEDLAQFWNIKKRIERLFERNNTNIKGFMGRLTQLKDKLRRLNTRIGIQAVVQGEPIVLMVQPLIELFLNGSRVTLMAANPTLLRPEADLAQVISRRNEIQDRYQQTLGELKVLQAPCVVLQVLSDNFSSLVKETLVEKITLTKLLETWQELGSCFSGLSTLFQEKNDLETREYIKNQLFLGLTHANKLKAFAEQLERSGVKINMCRKSEKISGRAPTQQRLPPREANNQKTPIKSLEDKI